MTELIPSVDSVTGVFTSSVVTSALDERIRDTIGTALVAGSNVTITVNDAGNTITIASSGGGSLFADPNADRIAFWDDSAGAFTPLVHSAPITITGTSLTVATATTTAEGVVELETAAETVSGSTTGRASTAAGVLATRGLYVGVNAQTGTTYAPVLTDQGKLVTCSNAAAITVTLPSDATTAFPIGTQIDFVVIGAGMVTFVAGASATVNGTPSLVTRAQWSAVTAIKRAANTWVLVGDLA